ncbi:hypothetical protein AHAS_Ahas11G0341900 [Arachis hypogaea]
MINHGLTEWQGRAIRRPTTTLSFYHAHKFPFPSHSLFSHLPNNFHQNLRMRNQRSVKQEFLRKWITGLRRYSCDEKKNMSFLERKKAIKLSADIAMASTRDKTTRWSQALIANASSSGDTLTGSSKNNSSRSRKKMLMMRRRRPKVKSAKKEMSASCIAKRLAEKRTRKLKNLLPGGESIDEGCLVEETLDYIESLRAQIEVMRYLVTASQLIINPYP